MLRVAGNAANYAEGVRRSLQREMPGASYVTITPFREIVGSQTKAWELGATMFVAFGVLALVRAALGAQTRDVVRLVVRQGVVLGVVVLAIGAAVALGAARWVKPLLFNES